MKSWFQSLALVCMLGVAPLTWAKATSSIEQSVQAGIRQVGWMQALKRVNPKDYAEVERELTKIFTQKFKEQHKYKNQLEMIADAITQLQQSPKFSDIMLRYVVYYSKADDATVMKFIDYRVRVMNRLLAHDDKSCYDWLMQNPNPDIVKVAIYEHSLFGAIMIDILQNYDPNRPIPSDKETESVTNTAAMVALKQMRQPVDLAIFDKSNLSDGEKRQYCEFERNFETQLLLHRQIDAMRWLANE